MDSQTSTKRQTKYMFISLLYLCLLPYFFIAFPENFILNPFFFTSLRHLPLFSFFNIFLFSLHSIIVIKVQSLIIIAGMARNSELNEQFYVIFWATFFSCFQLGLLFFSGLKRRFCFVEFWKFLYSKKFILDKVSFLLIFILLCLGKHFRFQ